MKRYFVRIEYGMFRPGETKSRYSTIIETDLPISISVIESICKSELEKKYSNVPSFKIAEGRIYTGDVIQCNLL